MTLQGHEIDSLRTDINGASLLLPPLTDLGKSSKNSMPFPVFVPITVSDEIAHQLTMAFSTHRDVNQRHPSGVSAQYFAKIVTERPDRVTRHKDGLPARFSAVPCWLRGGPLQWRIARLTGRPAEPACRDKCGQRISTSASSNPARCAMMRSSPQRGSMNAYSVTLFAVDRRKSSISLSGHRPITRSGSA
jgi:hypothetical protein